MEMTVTCQDCKGSQTISIEGMSLEMAKDYAAILDGSSDFFVYSPRGDANSLIGKCGVCKGQIDATVIE